MKRWFVVAFFIHGALHGIDPIARNPFAPAPLVDNELIATAYIHTTDTKVNFMVRGKKISAVYRGKKPLQLYTS